MGKYDLEDDAGRSERLRAAACAFDAADRAWKDLPHGKEKRAARRARVVAERALLWEAVIYPAVLRRNNPAMLAALLQVRTDQDTAAASLAHEATT